MESNFGRCKIFSQFGGYHDIKINLKRECTELRLELFGGQSVTKMNKKCKTSQVNGNLKVDPCCGKIDIVQYGGNHAFTNSRRRRFWPKCCILQVFGGNPSIDLQCH